MTQKSRKALNITVNVIVSIIVIFVLILTVNIIVSGNKGYTKLFGNAYVAVKSDSMDGDKPDSFKKGDMLKVKVLSEKEKEALVEGDVIMFYDTVQGVKIINTHRIVEKGTRASGEVYFRTQGDNPKYGMDGLPRTYEDIIGKVVSHTDKIGYVSLWLNSSTGFFVCVVLPSLLIVVYCVFNLVKAIVERNKEDAASKEAKMKEELLAQLRAEGMLVQPVAEGGAPAEPAQPERVAMPAQAAAPAEVPKEEPAPAAVPVRAESEEQKAPATEEAAAEEPKKPAAKTTAKKKQPIVLSADEESASVPAAEEPKKPATKTTARKKQPIVLSADEDNSNGKSGK